MKGDPAAYSLRFVAEQLTGIFDAVAHMHERIDDADGVYMDKNGFFLDPLATQIVILPDSTWALLAIHIHEGAFVFGRPIRSDGSDGAHCNPFRPPEGDRRSKAYAVWTMGCTVLELLVWHFNGPQGVAQFRADITPRRFLAESHTFVQRDGKIKEPVLRFLEHLCAPESQALAKGLGGILRCMLMVDKERRPSADVLARLCKKVLEKCSS
jgi:hypothetical protein